MSETRQSIAPIALFCYNRLDCLKQTIAALQANELASESDLFIFSDGPKLQDDSAAVYGVRAYLKTVTGFRSIHIKEAENNQGLADSIIPGVTEIVNRFGRIIVVEDDIVTSPYFLRFMNEALELYQDEEKVAGICGWRPPSSRRLPDVYFIDEVKCWGWATWKRGWDLFEADGKKLLAQFCSPEQINQFNCLGACAMLDMLRMQAEGQLDSWAVRWHASVFLAGKLGLQSGLNLVANAGYRSGTHYTADNQTPDDVISLERPVVKKVDPEISMDILRDVYVTYYNSLFHRESGTGSLPQVRKRLGGFLRKCCKAILPYGAVRFIQKYKHAHHTSGDL